MRTMDFIKFVQRPYTNVTVRRGYKWADLKIGETINLSANGVIVDSAKVSKIQVKKFSYITPEDIKREHDPNCTTKNGLLRGMKEAYPDFSEDEPVTIVTYVREMKIKRGGKE